MQFAKSTGYALHALMHMALSDRGHNIGIKELAAKLGVSESYLSKVMSKLRQDGIVRAVTGLNGGYELARRADQITFLDVIQVIEGRQQLYECANLNEEQHRLFFEASQDCGSVGENECSEEGKHDPFGKDCLVKKVMDGAEQRMNDYLREHTIQSVVDAACGVPRQAVE
ncbi:Rrf2 family transcriptional regulator [Paenibacillus sp. HB172176]|uniref:RrF2 family transcriptional regulator n=1 Tax=Paenibacillus sp. HB172176 TaxID=2493690 RepID=UPI00143A8608|nr:Rrf2 family transcriptional regulator [Paenibacillus sp. HB172176]